MHTLTRGPERTVLVLGGGGGRGAAQLGVLRALAERGIRPDACVGTSVGALNAAMVAAVGLERAVPLLEQVWASEHTRAVFRAQRLQMVANRLRRRPYLRSGQCIRDLVRFAFGLVDVRGYEDLQIPLHVIVTDLSEGTPVVLGADGHESLEDALCASCAIPGVFPAVRVGDRQYVDGGVTENCGLSTAYELQPTRIIAIDLTADSPVQTFSKWEEVLERMMQVALHARVVADFDRFSSRLPVTLICPRAPVHMRAPRVLDFAALRDQAFAAADRLLQRITSADGLLDPGVFYLPVAAD
ncbi:MAG TPA: patatin-like phospholipase family protein [Candidatus Dormibacteraeota bacterium]|nr:patatin-like phospholipase family protein [Candidatus Dormibacteraeota bacterium]